MDAGEKKLLKNLNEVMVHKKDDEKLSEGEFRRLQLVELELIKEVDRVCRKHDIKYSLFCGTLLGAVRHKGYIPWDDDADIAMLREEYNKFREVADELNPDICFFQDHKTDPKYLWGYGKIRKTGTTHMRTGQDAIGCKNGVYIDIFPLDDVPKSVIGQIFQDIDLYFKRKTLWSKVAKDTYTNPIKRFNYKCLSRIPVDKVYEKTEKYRRRSSNKTDNRVRNLLFPSFGKLYVKNPLKERFSMPKRWFLELEEYDFEGYKFYGTKYADGFLKYMYDDYMTPPPPEKRVPKVSYSELEF